MAKSEEDGLDVLLFTLTGREVGNRKGLIKKTFDMENSFIKSDVKQVDEGDFETCKIKSVHWKKDIIENIESDFLTKESPLADNHFPEITSEEVVNNVDTISTDQTTNKKNNTKNQPITRKKGGKRVLKTRQGNEKTFSPLLKKL